MATPQPSAALSALPEDAPRAGVIHVRHHHTDRYTVVGNHLAQHAALSLTAIGLAVHIQSLPDGASVTAKALTLRFREGETTIRRALNELEAAGYLERRRVALGGGRIATRTFAYDRPGRTRPPATRRPAPQPPSRPRPTAEPARAPAPPLAPASRPAAGLLAGLRALDARLLLPARDVHRLAPAVDAWLARAATPAQITRTLTADLPPGPIHHPARFLEHRLTTRLPPPLPPGPPRAPLPAPLETCDGCDRAFRTHDPDALCPGCRVPSPAPAEAA